MKRFAYVFSLLFLAASSSAAIAQDPAKSKEDGRLASRPDIAPTPEMWFYEQEVRRYDDPRTAVRRKAEFRARQRQARIAAMKWFGFSNARPRVNSTPWGAMYAPSWTSNTNRPYGWAGVGYPYVIERNSDFTYLR